MKYLLALLLLISTNAYSADTDRPVEYILNRVFDSSTNALNTSGGSSAITSGDSATADPDGIFYESSGGTTIKTDPAFIYDDTSGGLMIGKNRKGIIISGDAGIMTVGGTGNTNNETITLNFEGSSNRITAGSGTGASRFNWGTYSVETPDDLASYFGTGLDSIFEFDTAETNDTFKLGVVVNTAASSGVFALVEQADISTNVSFPRVADPTLALQGSDATQAAERGTLHYNSSLNRFQISTDTGSVFMTAPQGVSTDSNIVGTSANVGWSIVDQTDNQACNTGCNYACMFGIENATGTAVSNIVDCAGTTADLCMCMGPN